MKKMKQTKLKVQSAKPEQQYMIAKDDELLVVEDMGK